MSPKLLVILVGLLNLVAGLGGGVALGRASVERHRVSTGTPEFDVSVLADVLALPSEKDAKVRAILRSCRPRCDAVMEEVRPKMRVLHEQFLAELGTELTPAQIESLFVEYKRRTGDDIPRPR